MKHELKPVIMTDPASPMFEGEVDGLGLNGAVLLVDGTKDVEELLKQAPIEITRWNRYGYNGQPAHPWIPAGPFDHIIIRIPNDRLSFEMLVHAAIGQLKPEGLVWVYGMNDDGMRSVNKKLVPFFRQDETRLTKRHARLVSARDVRTNFERKTALSDWKETIEKAKLAGLTYPGIFSHGRIDPGTQRLLAHLPDVDAGASVLDYGCGNGILSAALIDRQPDLTIDMIDIYALAVQAASENVPKATAIMSDGFASVPKKKYDLILSNPPIHRGKNQDMGMLQAFIQQSKMYLKKEGELRFVVQQTVPVKDTLNNAGFASTSVGKDAVYEVWSAKLRG